VAFRDQSALLMGSNAEIRIDEFVFSRQSNDSAVEAVRIVRGAFRLVTGEVARNTADGVQLKVPAATLIVRESTVTGNCTPSSCDVRLEGCGEKNALGEKTGSVVILSRNGASSVLTHPGQAVHIEMDGTLSRVPSGVQAELDGFFDMFSPEASRDLRPPRGGASAAVASDAVSLPRLSHQAIIEAIEGVREQAEIVDNLDQVLRQMPIENGTGVPPDVRGSN
jgi:hypothetical protein